MVGQAGSAADDLEILQEVPTSYLDAAIAMGRSRSLYPLKTTIDGESAMLVRAALGPGRLVDTVSLALAAIALVACFAFALRPETRGSGLTRRAVVSMATFVIAIAVLVVNQLRAKNLPVAELAKVDEDQTAELAEGPVLIALLSTTRRVKIATGTRYPAEVEEILSAVVALLKDRPKGAVSAVALSVCGNTFESDKRCREIAQALDVTALRQPLVGGNSVLYQSIDSPVWQMKLTPATKTVRT